MVNIRKSRDGQYFYNVTGDNNEILVNSENLTVKGTCISSIAALKEQLARVNVATGEGIKDLTAE